MTGPEAHFDWYAVFRDSARARLDRRRRLRLAAAILALGAALAVLLAGAGW